jgi:hypothetical protein
MKLCVFCKHFYLDMGHPGYSELTPGYSASIECLKDHWNMSNRDDTSTYREHIIKAETCPDYDSAGVI